MRRNILLVMLLLALCLFPGYAYSSPAEEWEPDFLDMKVGGSAQGGTWFVYAAKMAEILNEAIPGLRAAATLGGGNTNIVAVHTNEYPLAMMHAFVNYLGWMGTGPFSEQYRDIRYVMSLFPAASHWIAPKTLPINTVEELINQTYKISLPSQSGSGQTWAEETFKACGFTTQQLIDNGSQISYTSPVVSTQSLQDGLADVIHILDPVRTAVGLELDNMPGIKELTLTPEQVKAIADKNPGLIPVELPGGMYSGNPESTMLIGSMNCVIVNKDVSDEMVYRITKALVEHLDALNSVFPPEHQLTVGPTLVEGVSIPMHPGAKRYFEEIGLKVVEPNL